MSDWAGKGSVKSHSCGTLRQWREQSLFAPHASYVNTAVGKRGIEPLLNPTPHTLPPHLTLCPHFAPTPQTLSPHPTLCPHTPHFAPTPHTLSPHPTLFPHTPHFAPTPYTLPPHPTLCRHTPHFPPPPTHTHFAPTPHTLPDCGYLLTASSDQVRADNLHRYFVSICFVKWSISIRKHAGLNCNGTLISAFNTNRKRITLVCVRALVCVCECAHVCTHMCVCVCVCVC